MPDIFFISLKEVFAASNVLPLRAVIFKSESNELSREPARCSKPLKTESTTISAIVPTQTPTAEIMEIMLIALCDFLEKR